MLLRDFCAPEGRPVALELGCGDAANYASFNSYGYSYHGMDGSKDALITALRNNPELEGRLAVGDFTNFDFPPGLLLIADRAAIAHNDTASIRRCVQNIYKALPVQGLFLGVDWFSTKHSELQRGEVVDEYTRTGYTEGQFANVGRVHFASQAEIESLFSDFEIALLRERVTIMPAGYPTKTVILKYVSQNFAGKEYVSSVWDIVAIKRA